MWKASNHNGSNKILYFERLGSGILRFWFVGTLRV